MLKQLWITDLLNLFFPNVCMACGNALVEQEEVLCLPCLFKLPKTNFHLTEENQIARVFWGRVNLEAATSFLFFSKGGNVQHLMHQLKYSGKRHVGVYLGKLLGIDLKESSTYSTVDVIVPVPLHPKKQHQRGFNQSAVICSGIGSAMGKTVSNNNLVRLVHTSSQTKKSRYSRWENVKDVFGVNDSKAFEGKHLLLIDDVLTTGATLEACAQKLLEVNDVKVSVATLAYALV